MLEHHLLLFIFAFVELRILPQPDFDWAPPWLTAHFAGRGITPEQAWNGLMGTVVLCARETGGTFLVLLGLHPVVEMYMVDFLAVAMDALLNHASKLETFSGGTWTAPLVIRAPCGGGYGDGGQHEQSLWGWLAHIPGLTVVVPSTPADAGALMLAALQHDGPVLFLEHKLLSESCLEFLGSGGRSNVSFDVPVDGACGQVPRTWQAASIGKAVLRREGNDITIVSVGVGVHRALQAAETLEREGVSAAVIDLRTVSPLDSEMVCEHVAATRRLLVVDEDYEGFGLSGELAALVSEAGLQTAYARVCTRATIPYSRDAEDRTLPNVDRVRSAAMRLMS